MGFEDKDYWNYMKSLEEKIDNSQKSASAKKEHDNKTNIEIKPKETPRRRKEKRNFSTIFKSKDTALVILLSLIIVILITAIVFAAVKTKKLLDNKLNETQITSVPEKVVQENEPELISYDFPDETPDILSGNDAKYAVVIDKTNNKVIAARNPHESAYPASTTKVMTLLVAVENITDFDDTFTMTYEITDPLYKRGASLAGFKNAEVVNMTDLLYGLILPSGADAAVGLATKIAGSEEAFVELMNKKAEELGLQNTHFTNSSGLFDEQHYTTAYDMSIILSAAMKNELCKTVLSTKKYTTKATEQNPEGILLSSTLFDYMYGTEPEIATITGGKTGFVNQSGYCIASFGSNNTNGNEYIIVSLCNSSRWPAFHGQIDLYKEYAK